VRLAASLALCVALAGCGALPLGMLGGGPNVAANVQAGRENRQTAVGFEERVEAGRDVIQKEVETGQVETLTVNNQDIPPWVILLALIGWLLPTPTQMGNAIGQFLMAPFRRKT
jgi:hypothetical protein